MSDKKFHVTPTGQARECSAKTPEGCKYAENGVAPEHYATKLEAQAAYEQTATKTYSSTNTLKKTVKKTFPEVINSDSDFGSLTSNERADYAIYKGFKNFPSACIGVVNGNTYYGYRNNEVGENIARFFMAHDGDLAKRDVLKNNIASFEKKGFKFEFIKSSFASSQTSSFVDTFADYDSYVQHVSAKTLVTAPNGDQAIVPVTAQATYSELLSAGLDADDEMDPQMELLILKDAVKKASRYDEGHRY